MKGEDVVFSANRSEKSPLKDLWRTPRSVIDFIERRHGTLTCDAATEPEFHAPSDGIRSIFTPQGRYEKLPDGRWKKYSDADSLADEPWRDAKGYPVRRVFLNPPYSKASLFLRRAVQAIEHDRVREIVVLVAARTDTRWFQPLFEQASEIVFMRGRVRFRPPEAGESERLDPAPFPSSIVLLDRKGGPARCLGWGRATRIS